MKRILSLLLAALVALSLIALPALAEATATEAPQTTVSEVADEVKQEAEDTVEEVKEAAEDAVEEVKETAEDAVTEAKEAVGEALDEVSEEGETEEAPQKTWFETAFGKFAKVPVYFWVIIAVLLVLGIVCAVQNKSKNSTLWSLLSLLCFLLALAVAIFGLFNGGIFSEDIATIWYILAIVALLAVMILIICIDRKNGWDARAIAYAAMSITIAFVLSMIKLYRMPQGGTITPASMLPLILFTLAFGFRKGLVVGCAYGLLQLIEDPWVIHPLQLLVDYPMAFGAVALCAIVALFPIKNFRVKIIVAIVLAFLGRYIMAVLSGVVFFSEYAGEQNALLYSLGYNITYLGPDLIFTCLVACIPGMERLLNMMKGSPKKA